MLNQKTVDQFDNLVKITKAGGDTIKINFTFRYMRGKDVKAHWDNTREKDEIDQIFPLIINWDSSAAGGAYSREALAELCDLHAGAAMSIAGAFTRGLRGEQEKN